jgi:hypothetical protein
MASAKALARLAKRALEVPADAGQVFTKGLSHVVEGKIYNRAINMLEESGLDIPTYLTSIGKKKFSPSTLRKAFKDNNLSMKFDDDSWPEELKRLGIRYIPDYDYWGSGLKGVIKDEKSRGTVRDVLLHNQRVVANLHTNPALPLVLGRQLNIDPVLAPKWYSRLGNQMERNWGIGRENASALRGKLSSGTSFPKETKSAINIIENPKDMYAAGNQNTEEAIKRMIRGNDYMEDPSLWSGQGADSKTFNYAMNYIDPLNPSYVTNDIHQYAIGTGLGKELGSNPAEIFASRDLYNMYSDVTKQVADEMGMLPNEAQSLMWTIWRDLMSGDTSGFEKGRKLIVAPEVQRAIEGKPKGLLDAMGFAARKHQGRQIAGAKTKYADRPEKLQEAIELATQRGDRRVGFTQKLADEENVKLDPRIRALMLLLGGGGAGAAAANNNGRPEESNNFSAVSAMNRIAGY